MLLDEIQTGRHNFRLSQNFGNNEEKYLQFTLELGL
jgi:hypothetical protein